MTKCTVPPAGWDCSRAPGHDGPRAASPAATEPKYLLVKRGLFYAPSRQGYTGIKARAGRYLATDAMPDAGVTAIHEDEAPMFSPACWQEVKVEFLLERIADGQRAMAALLPDVLCGESWGLPDDERVSISVKFGALRAARAWLAELATGERGPRKPDDALLRDAVRLAKPRNTRGYRPRWVAVMDTFAIGSTFAHELCDRFGFNPDEKVRQ